MTEQEVYKELNGIFREVFRDEKLVATPEMTAEDVEHWDSLSHIDMISMVEERFSIRIPSWQIATLGNVKELANAIVTKINA